MLKQQLAATCSHMQPLAATCQSSHLQPLGSHLLKQPLAATWQPLAASGCLSKWLPSGVFFLKIKLRTSCAHNANLSTLSTFWIHCVRKFQLLASSREPLLRSRFQWQWFLMLLHSSRVQLEVCWHASAYPHLSCWSAAGNPCWTASFKAVVGQLMILWFNHGISGWWH